MHAAESRRVEPGCLVYTLFIWVTILSLCLAVTLTLVLTARPLLPAQARPNFPLGHVTSQEITMETGKSSERRVVLPWAPGEASTEDEPLAVQRERLVVKRGWDGRYFLYVQVTLQSSDNTMVARRVQVKQGGTTLLEGILTRGTSGEAFSTGFLGRQVNLYSDEHIAVSCSNPSYFNTTDSATYLGVYLLRRE